MNQIVIPGTPASQRSELHLLTHVLYGLHTLSWFSACLLYTSDAADERSSVDLGGRRIIKQKT